VEEERSVVVWICADLGRGEEAEENNDGVGCLRDIRMKSVMEWRYKHTRVILHSFKENLRR